MSNEKKGCIEIFIGGALWGSIGIFVTKMSECGADSVMTALIRMAFSFGILALLTLIRYGAAAFRIDFKTLAVCALLGLICHGIYNVFYSIAIVNTGITVGAVLLNAAPVFTAIEARILFSEGITRRKTAAIVINIIGCVLAVTGGRISLVDLSVTGIIFGVLAGFCYSLTAIIGRMAGSRTNAFVMSTYSYLFAALFLLISAKPIGSSLTVSPAALGWGFLLALIPTAAAYLIYYAGVQKVKETSKVPVYASVETVVAAVLGIAVNHEVIGIVSCIGIAIVLASIALMNKTQ